jgi:hypothetical protein
VAGSIALSREITVFYQIPCKAFSIQLKFRVLKSLSIFLQNLTFNYSSQFLACPEKQTCLWLLHAQVLVDIEKDAGSDVLVSTPGENVAIGIVHALTQFIQVEQGLGD